MKGSGLLQTVTHTLALKEPTRVNVPPSLCISSKWSRKTPPSQQQHTSPGGASMYLHCQPVASAAAPSECSESIEGTIIMMVWGRKEEGREVTPVTGQSMFPRGRRSQRRRAASHPLCLSHSRDLCLIEQALRDADLRHQTRAELLSWLKQDGQQIEGDAGPVNNT
jgi:hypothetical protein